MPYLGEGRRLVAVDGDEEAFGIEAVHLDQPVLVGDGAVHDKEDEVAAIVKLRTLAEVLGILQGERMELEDIAKYGEVLHPGRDRSIQKKLRLASRRLRLLRRRFSSPTCSS
jgi:hypothetical protein